VAAGGRGSPDCRPAATKAQTISGSPTGLRASSTDLKIRQGASRLCLVWEGCWPHFRCVDLPRLLRRSLAVAAVVLLSSSLLPLSLEAQTSRKALTKNEVIELLESGVPPARVEQLARQYGLAFSVTPAVETELRDAGATDELVDALRSLVPKPPLSTSPAVTSTPPVRPTGPPVLLIEATPGGAQVYVDDEPVGTTSSSGRLKLSQLSPGEHSVRFSLPGHRDYETRVTLAAGETTPLTATLEAARTSAAANPPVAGASGTAPPGPATPSVADGTATLGALLARQAPPGRRGAYISDVAPGGPAEKAGLRAGYSILTIEDRAINSAQDALQAVAQFQPGTTVRITYSDGQEVQTTRARLVARSSVSPPTAPSASLPSGNPPAGAVAAARARFTVAHDHGSAGSDYCVGVMTIGGGMIQYRSTNGLHSFDFPLGAVREARRNAVYLAALGTFHIRLKKGGNFNFILLNAAGQFQPPDALLLAIDQALGRP
jgi:hypothetical protein